MMIISFCYISFLCCDWRWRFRRRTWLFAHNHPLPRHRPIDQAFIRGDLLQLCAIHAQVHVPFSHRQNQRVGRLGGGERFFFRVVGKPAQTQTGRESDFACWQALLVIGNLKVGHLDAVAGSGGK